MPASASSPTVLCEVADGVAVLTLNRPRKLNAVDESVLCGLEQAFNRLETDPSLRVLVLTGAGGNFTSGIDLGIVNGDPERFLSFLERELLVLYDRLTRLQVPVIAAIEGYAYATGTEVTLCTDIAYAGRGAGFCFPDLSVGLVAATGRWRVSEKLTRMRFGELLLTGAPFDAQAAYELGLLTRVVDDGEALATALEVADAIAAKPALPVRLSCEALNHNRADDWAGFLALQRRVILSPEFRAGRPQA